MAEHEHDPLDHPEVQSASTAGYVGAFALAMTAMIVSCLITIGAGMGQLSTLIVIGILALIVVCAQLYLLFKLDLSEAMIWHTVTAAATIPLFIIAIALTTWMFQYLETRVIVGGG